MDVLVALIALTAWGTDDLIQLAEEGDLAAIKQAISTGADIVKTGPAGILPLHAAARHGKSEVVQFLLEAGTPIDARDEDGWTPLLFATSEGHLEVFKILQAEGADLNAVDNNGFTALLMAASNENLDMMRYLLDVEEVDLSARDNEDRTAYDLVHYSGNKTLRELVRTKVGPGRAEPEAGVFSALVDGKPLDLSAYRGKVVLLDFWATWCKPCHAAIPTLRKLHKKSEKSPFVLIGISVDVTPAKVVEFVDKKKMGWAHYMDPRGKLSSQEYKIRSYPSYILIDHEGKIIFRDSGWSRRVGDELHTRTIQAIKQARKAQAK